MLTIILSYTILSLATLIALSRMILEIGKMLGDCPKTVATARAASVTIATGYSAIGTGGVLIIAAVLPLLHQTALVALFSALGLATICLGLGFTHAINTLRTVIAPPRQTTPDIRPAEPAAEPA